MNAFLDSNFRHFFALTPALGESLGNMASPWVLFSLGVLGINAFFVATQSALFQYKAFSEARDPGGLASHLLRHAQRLVLILRLGKLVCSALVGVSMVVWTQLLFGKGLCFGFLAVGFVQLSAFSLLGVYMPKRLGLRMPEKTLQWGAPLILILGAWLYPWAWLLEKLCGGKIQDESLAESSMRLEALVGVKGLPDSPYLRGMMERAGHMQELELADVLVPRESVIYFNMEVDLKENLQLAKDSGHTRFPLCQGDLDKCVGIVHTKDIFGRLSEGEEIDLNELHHPLLRFASNLSLEATLRRLLAARLHMAVVQDEFGGTVGLVTLEDIFEELVGNIDDEFDTPERDLVIKLGENHWQVDALVPLHTFSQCTQRPIEGEESATFGGFLTERIGRIPRSGEVVKLENLGLEVKVRSASSRRILLTEVFLKEV